MNGFIVPPRPAPLGETGRLAYILDGVLFVADWDGRKPVRVAGASLEHVRVADGAGLDLRAKLVEDGCLAELVV